MRNPLRSASTLDGGWPAVFATTAQVLVAFLVVALLLHLAGNLRVALTTARRQE
ncbi:hypothetical protein [Sinomonas notoginsengisoli]|uniref:hypothetical protein n=1 Tax=Sinomonas notoginsengisoli TaxID=1457311 RepID=UPI001F25765A|nr:hypothetical protein [Sinomonas notoginsengisoli]